MGEADKRKEKRRESALRLQDLIRCWRLDLKADAFFSLHFRPQKVVHIIDIFIYLSIKWRQQQSLTYRQYNFYGPLQRTFSHSQEPLYAAASSSQHAIPTSISATLRLISFYHLSPASPLRLQYTLVLSICLRLHIQPRPISGNSLQRLPRRPYS